LLQEAAINLHKKKTDGALALQYHRELAASCLL